MEEQVLPHPDLRPAYDRTMWVWVYRDFQGGDADRAALRVEERFGINSYPHLLFVTPDGTVVGESPRSVEGMLRTMERAQEAIPPQTSETAGRIRSLAVRIGAARAGLAARGGARARALEDLRAMAAEPDPWEFHIEARELLDGEGRREPPLTDLLRHPGGDRRADALERLADADAAAFAAAREAVLPLLDDPDPVVRLRAWRCVRAHAPTDARDRLAALLEDPSDTLRFWAADALKEDKRAADAPALLAALERLETGALSSTNPNALKCRIVVALAECGDGGAIDLLGRIVARREVNNGLTYASIAAIGSIASRSDAAAGAAATRVLLDGFPDPWTPEAPRDERGYLAYVRQVGEALGSATGRTVPVPERWGAVEREAHIAAWRAAVGP